MSNLSKDMKTLEKLSVDKFNNQMAEISKTDWMKGSWVKREFALPEYDKLVLIKLYDVDDIDGVSYRGIARVKLAFFKKRNNVQYWQTQIDSIIENKVEWWSYITLPEEIKD